MEMETQKLYDFYFTYGDDPGFPYRYGWTVIQAESYALATLAFSTFHPNREGSKFLNCAGIYDETSWSTTKMAKHNSNCGHGCWERITVMYVDIQNNGDFSTNKADYIIKNLCMIREVLEDG